jgi:translation elongation factor EF-Tu-like GTPase
VGLTPDEIERTIVGLLEQRAEGRTICPSEAARALAADWRPLMQPVRDVAYAMADEGRLEVTQKGTVVDGRTARGAIRLRKPRERA